MFKKYILENIKKYLYREIIYIMRRHTKKKYAYIYQKKYTKKDINIEKINLIIYKKELFNFFD